MEKRKNTQPIRTALTYIVFGALWILLSDNLLVLLFPADPQKYAFLQTIKGWLFVCASALLIYLFLRRDIHHLTESEQRYKLLFDNNPNPMWVYDAETLRFLTVNDAAIQHYGYTREEFLAMTLKDIRPEEEVTTLMANVAVQTAPLQRSEGWKHRKKDGTLIDVEISSHSLKFGERSARLVLAHDVTEKKAAEEALRQSEVQFRTLVEQLPAITYIAALDEVSTTLYISPQVEELLGIPPDEYIKKPSLWLEHVHPEDRARVLEKIQEGKAADKPLSSEYRMITGNGRIIWFRDEGTLVRNEKGEALFLEGVMYDITERKATAEKLAYQAELLSNVHDAIIGADADFHITYWNKTAEEVFGWTTEEALGRHTKDLFQTKFPNSTRKDAIQKLLTEGKLDGELLYMRKDGVYINVDLRAVVLKDEQGNPKGFLSSIRDATERKQSELTLRRNEQIMREAQTIAKLGSWTADLQAGLFYVNAETAQLMGWPIGIQPLEELLKAAHPDDRVMVEAMWAEAQQSGRDYDIEHRIIVNGKVRWMHATAKITYSEEQVPLSAIGILQDITERKMAEEALKVSEENYRNLAETSDSAIVVLNRDGRILYANPASIRIWNDPRLIGKTIHDLYPKEFADKYLSAVHRVIDEQTTDLNELESEIRGKTMWFRASMSPLKSSDGTSNALLLNALDITDRKQAELALQHSEERFRTALDNMLEGIQFLSFEWRYLYLNAAAERHNRRPNQELMGNIYMEMWPGIEETHVFTVIKRCMEERSPQQLQNEFVYPDGHVRWFDLSILPIPEGVLIQSIDITERKQAEEKLRKSEERFRQLAENIEEGFWITDPKNEKEVYLSPANARIWGNSIENLMQSTNRFIESILPEDQPRVLAEIEKQRYGVQTDLEYRIQQPDGSVRWIWDRAFPILGEDGQVSLVAGLASDITERKQTTERIQTQLERLKALSAIDNAISTSMDMRLTLDIFLREAMTQLKVDAADVLLLNNTLLTLQYLTGSGFNGPEWGKGELKLGEGLAGRAALKRQRIHIPNLAKLEDEFVRSNLYEVEGFITYFGVPLIAKGQIKGVLEILHRSELDPDPEWLDYLNTLAGQAAIAIDSAQLFEGLQRSNFELIMAYDATIAGWSHAMDLRDKETEGHTQRVTEMTVQLAERMGISKQEQVQIRRGALLHDIGKLGVPDHILLKPGKLTDEEWVIMRQHPAYAYEMLLPIHYLRPALDIPYCHHEKWDGSGYPRKLKGEEIPLSARIFAVVDVWDALRSDRPYRDGWSAEKTRDYILAESGKHFDPQVVAEFIKMLDSSTDFQ